jgi:hypothetical protein
MAVGWTLALVLALSPAAFAQVARGNIYGTVTDESGALLPGASVTLSGELGTRTTTSGGAGEFRFLNVDHGTHSITATLTGFAGVSREVLVQVGSNVEIDFSLKIATVQETVTVTAESPVIDGKKLGTATNIAKDELLLIPSSRDPWALMRTVPGILVDRVNIAGSESGQQSSFLAKGSDPKDQVWTLDGIVVTDEVSWSSPSYWSYDTFDEVNFTTGGADVTLPAGGVGINLATKRGTNSFHGGVNAFYTSDDLQWSNIPDELVDDPRLQGNDKADHTDEITDVSFDIGGPILKDKLWFYGSYGRNDIQIRRLTQTSDKTLLQNYTAKLNWQVGPNDMISAFWFNGVKSKAGRATGLQPEEEAGHLWDQGGAYQEGRPGGLSKLEWNHVFSNRFVLNTKAAYYNTGFGLAPIGGLDTREVDDRVNQIARGSANDWTFLRPQYTGNIDANYFVGDHELKFGAGFRRNGTESIRTQPADKVRVIFNTTGADAARFYRDAVTNARTDRLSFYLADTFTKDRLTVNASLRFDRQTATSLATSSTENPAIPNIMPSLDYAGSDGNVAEWNNLNPRIAVNYALGEDRRTILRASYSRYAGTLPVTTGNWNNPVATSILQYDWADANGDNDVQLAEVDFNSLQFASNIDPNNPTSASSPNQIDPDLKANIDNEIVFGIDHELLPDLAVSAAYTWRRSTDLTATQLWSGTYWYNWIGPNGAYTASDFVAQDSVTLNGYTATSYLPTDEASAGFTGGILLNNRDDLSRTFNGVELSLVKRLSHKWMARAAFSFNNWKENVGPGAIANPTRHDWDPLDDGGQVVFRSSGSGKIFYTNAKWQFNANALYQLPADFEISGNIFGRQGYPNPTYLTLSSGFDGFLRVLPDGFKIDQDRFDRLWNLDLRLAKNFRLGETVRLSLAAEMFNVFNSNAELKRNRDASSSVFNRLDEILAPRIVRFGARLSF